MSGVILPGPGLVIPGGGGGVSLPTDDPGAVFGGVAGGPAILGVDGPGDGVLMTPTLVRSALTTTPDATGTGWTQETPSSGTSTTWSGGTLTVSIPSGVAAGFAAGAARSDADTGAIDVAIRARITAGNSGALQSNISLRIGTDSNNHALISCDTQGNVVTGRVVGGAWTQHAVAGVSPSAGERSGGQMWLRLRRDEDGVSASWGLGNSGARPTTWVTFGAEAAAVAAAAGAWRRIGADSWSGGPAATTTWEVLSIAERARL